MESGEGIESVLDFLALPFFASGSWNPVKELKAPGTLSDHGYATDMWNPVKELKDIIDVDEKVQHGVESGEGIERPGTPLETSRKCWRVESGEGIESLLCLEVQPLGYIRGIR